MSLVAKKLSPFLFYYEEGLKIYQYKCRARKKDELEFCKGKFESSMYARWTIELCGRYASIQVLF